MIGHDLDGSIINLGCGFDDFLRFLRSSGHYGQFTGYDIAPDMIAAARKLHGEGEDRRWRVGAAPFEAADFAITSGIFNVKATVPAEIWHDNVHQTLDVLACAGRKGLGFNILSLSSDPDRR